MTYPISSRTLASVALPEEPSAWLGHVPFALWLVEVVKPGMLVELGTHHGHSYFSFCQAVTLNQLDTKCFGVDSWLGDEHAGEYGEVVFAAVDRLNEKHYSAFSRLLRMTFDEAERYFSDGSIDLLHIDGLHTYDAVRHDFETWLPKLSDRAVVLLHDTQVRERDFGVWRFWEELSARYPSFGFSHCHGLGVLLVGSRQPEELTELAAQWDEPRIRLFVSSLYAKLGRSYELESRLREERKRSEAVAEHLQASAERLQASEAALTDLRGEFEEAAADHQSALQYLESEVSLATREAAQLAREAAKLKSRLGAAESQLQSVLQSSSWQLTRPYRWAGHQAKRLLSARALLPAALRLTGGFPKLLRKGIVVLRHEGVQGVKLRLRYLATRGQGTQGPTPRVHDGLAVRRSPEVRPHSEAVDIVVCVHNALADVKNCLQSLLAKTRPPYRLIVVDDGSDPETAEYLREFMVGQPGILIRHDSAKGYTLAANAGMRQSKGDFVVMLNSDTIVTSLWLDRMIECARSDPRIGLVGPLSNTASWQSVPQLFNGDGDWAENRPQGGASIEDVAAQVASASLRTYPRTGFLNGFCLLIRRELIDKIGLFDEKRFARGFGEENDYCLRTAKADFELAVAEDAYVFHAQSRSYSSERRLALARDADVALREAHSDELIMRSLESTRENRVLAAMRARVAAAAERRDTGRALQERHEGRRVLFVLPVCDSGGGANVVIEESRALAAWGVIVGIANLAQHREAFEASYPDLDIPVIYLDRPVDLSDHVASFDAIVATLFLSVDWVLSAVKGLARPPVVGYYAQDFEPHFFDSTDPHHAQAKASYAMAPLRLFTKTAWNAREIQEHTGAVAICVGPSFAWHRFIPGQRPRNPNPVEVVAMVRPSTPRRSPELTVRVLERLAADYGSRIRIHVFGVDASHGLLRDLARSGRCSLHGEVTSQRVSEILRQVDIFLDFSTYQAMGLTALEAMASGVAVVGPRRGGLAEIVEHEASGLLVDTRDESQCLQAARRLIDDWEFRDRLIQKGFEVAAGCYPERPALAIMEALLPEGACDGGQRR